MNNYQFLLLVMLKGNKSESYYADSIDKLKQYAEFRGFAKYEIYELKKVKV